MNDTAILSSFPNYTTFTCNDTKLTFRTCDGLERYTSVKTWDNGYIEVMAKYENDPDEVEEYIDLLPMLDNLYMDKNVFLSSIRKVVIQYDE